MKSNIGKSYFCRLHILVLSFSFVLIAISGCNLFNGKSPYTQQQEEIFRATLGIPIELKIHLLTDKEVYHREDWIGTWVENGTDISILYPNQDLGLQAYQYDEQNENWRLVNLGSKLGNPRETTVKAGFDPITFAGGSFPVDRIEAFGRIRLVIIGTTEEDQPIATYKDVEIVD